MQGSYIGYYSGFPSLGGGFDSRTLLHKKDENQLVFVLFLCPGTHNCAPFHVLNLVTFQSRHLHDVSRRFSPMLVITHFATAYLQKPILKTN